MLLPGGHDEYLGPRFLPRVSGWRKESLGRLTFSPGHRPLSPCLVVRDVRQNEGKKQSQLEHKCLISPPHYPEALGDMYVQRKGQVLFLAPSSRGYSRLLSFSLSQHPTRDKGSCGPCSKQALGSFNRIEFQAFSKLWAWALEVEPLSLALWNWPIQ